MWGPIIAELLKLLGPLLKDLIDRWFARQLDAAAARLGHAPPARRDAASRELLEEVRASLWFWEPRRKRLLDRLIQAAPAALMTGGFTGPEERLIAADARGC